MYAASHLISWFKSIHCKSGHKAYNTKLDELYPALIRLNLSIIQTSFFYLSVINI